MGWALIPLALLGAAALGGGGNECGYTECATYQPQPYGYQQQATYPYAQPQGHAAGGYYQQQQPAYGQAPYAGQSVGGQVGVGGYGASAQYHGY